jgi:hypothetical protein
MKLTTSDKMILIFFIARQVLVTIIFNHQKDILKFICHFVTYVPNDVWRPNGIPIELWVSATHTVTFVQFGDISTEKLGFADRSNPRI